MLKVAAVLLPAVTVVFVGTQHEKRLCWLLTCCFYLPGSIYALNVICRAQRGLSASR
jgi:uncharacterized membrane protein YqaE (UPF0057 family)